MEEIKVSSGFLVVKTFERMYREYLNTFRKWWRAEFPNYGPILVEQMPGKYRGLARDPIQPWTEKFRGTGVTEPTDQELAASLLMTELEDSDRAADDFIFELEDAIKLMEMIPPPIEREIIWARRMDKNDKCPPDTELLGYEPNDFYGGYHESVLANNAFFVYCRTEEEKNQLKQFEKFHARLNKCGLFDTPTDVQKYLDLVFELNPDEHHGVKYIAEIRSVNI